MNTTLKPARWVNGPPMCAEANLPAFTTEKMARRYFDLRLPAASVKAVWHCPTCGRFHVQSAMREPSGATSGTGTRHLTKDLAQNVQDTAERLSRQDTQIYRKPKR